MARNCRDNTVEVRILLPDSSEVFSQCPADVDCDKKDPGKAN